MQKKQRSEQNRAVQKKTKKEALKMAALNRAVEWLRPLVDNMQWDYSIIWTLGDDPSRFIKWGACCCSGGNRFDKKLKIKEETGHTIDECRDRLINHPVRTKACQVLAKLPAAIPLYSSGAHHGDVLISKQAKWLLAQSNSSALDNEVNGTQVLIPTAFGLIELFSSKNLPKDQKLTDYISSQFKVSFTQVYMPEKANAIFNLKEPCDLYSSTHFDPSTHHLNFPSNSKQNNNLRSKKKRNSDCDDLEYAYEEVSAKKRQKAKMGPYKSKNLLTERKRREKIKYGMLSLRALVPNISNMDRMATLDDAADYIEELHKTIENYCKELTAMEEEDSIEITANSNITKLNEDEKYESVASGKTSTDAQLVEVSQTGTKDFLLKLICKKKQGGFSRLMEVMASLGLQVTDANVTTLNDLVLNILKVKAYGADLEPKSLKETLIQLVK